MQIRIITLILSFLLSQTLPAGAQSNPDRGGPTYSMGTTEEIAHFRHICDIVDQGDNFLWSGKTEQALAAYNLAVQREPTYHAAYEGVGDARMKQGKFPEAIRAYRTAAKQLPDATNFFRLAVAYGHLGDYDEAVKAYREGLTCFKEYPFGFEQVLNRAVSPDRQGMARIEEALLLYRGHDFQGVGNYEWAISLFREARHLNPNLAESALMLAKSLIVAKQYDEARTLLASAGTTRDKGVTASIKSFAQVIPPKTVQVKPEAPVHAP